MFWLCSKLSEGEGVWGGTRWTFQWWEAEDWEREKLRRSEKRKRVIPIFWIIEFKYKYYKIDMHQFADFLHHLFAINLFTISSSSSSVSTGVSLWSLLFGNPNIITTTANIKRLENINFKWSSFSLFYVLLSPSPRFPFVTGTGSVLRPGLENGLSGITGTGFIIFDYLISSRWLTASALNFISFLSPN